MSNEIEDLRIQLLANGYIPIPSRDKRTFMPGWPGVEATVEEIRSWSRRFRRDKATGLRIEAGLVAMDLDINHPVVDKIADRILDMFPQLEKDDVPLLIRRGKGHKEAWFFQCDELFSRIHSRRWLAPGESEDDGAHFVEVFGGASARQFGAFGPHTRLDNGEVAVWYRWVDRSPADTPKRQLPKLTKADFHAIVDMIEEELLKAGFVPVQRSTKGESDAVRSYDLTDAMFFDLDDGRRLRLSELREVAHDSVGLRCSPSFIEGNSSRNTTRCIIGTSKAGHLTVWDSATGITHMPVDAETRTDQLGQAVNRLAEKMQELKIRSQNKLHARDGAVVAAAKLLATWAFCPALSKAPVVPLWTSSLEGGITMTNFRTMMLPHADEEVGPKGGRSIINPVDIWAGSEKRMTVAGTQLRPDQPRPTFVVGDELWINCYDPPSHEAEGGDATVGIAFMEQIVPDERERAWWLQALAYKLSFPHVPGPGIVFVAHRTFGTGRGTLKELLGLLFGYSYVKEMSYDMVVGRTYQSQYNAWAADSLIVFVNESSEAEAGMSTYASKHKTYEKLKELIEPRPTLRTYVTHGRPAFRALSTTTFIICTNHADAIPIPEDDRRLAVLQNGGARDPEYWAGVNDWMRDPANVAAFHRWLMTVDIVSYDPFAPPIKTKAKRTMADEGKTDLDHALALALKELPARLVTMSQVLAAMRKVEREYDMDFPDRWQPIAKRMVRSILHRIGVRESTNWQVMIDGKKHAVYARDAKTADIWEQAEGVRDEVIRNDGALPSAGVVGIFDGIKRK